MTKSSSTVPITSCDECGNVDGTPHEPKCSRHLSDEWLEHIVADEKNIAFTPLEKDLARELLRLRRKHR